MGWFRDLPSVTKLILVGMVLLLLSTVLSPIARVVAIIAFVGSAVVLAVRAIQRGPVKGWGIATVASFVLIFVFGGISAAVYGYGSAVPEYEVDFEVSDVSEGGYSFAFFWIGTSSISDRNLQAIAEDMISKTNDYDSVSITIYDGDEARFRNGEGVYSLDDGSLYPEDIYNVWIAHTPGAAEETYPDESVGRYVIERVPGPGNSDTEDYDDTRHYDYEEAEIETNEVDSPDGDSTGVLESMIRGGMMNGDENIEDVSISGGSAVVVVASDVSEGYAQSVCDFALEAAQSYDSQSGYGDSLSITQVAVKRPWRPWNAASCSL